MLLEAAVDGFGLAYVVEDRAAAHIAAGRLVRVLDEWCEPYSGYHLYCPSRRQHAPAFALVVEALRYRGADAESEPSGRAARVDAKPNRA